MITERDKKRFWGKVNKNGPTPNKKPCKGKCWIWIGAKIPSGYGRIIYNGNDMLAHRFVYTIINKIIPEKMFVCHKCDNKTCVRPGHLYFGTAKDNARDRTKRIKNIPYKRTKGTGTQEERFWNLVNKGGTCWEWNGSIAPNGYGRFWYTTDKSAAAHRWIYEYKHKITLAKNIFVCHRCNNRKCVRPEHLTAEPHIENMKHMTKSKRSSQGINHHKCKLTEKQVIEIRRLYDNGNYGFENIGKLYGISGTNVSAIVAGEIWKHLL